MVGADAVFHQFKNGLNPLKYTGPVRPSRSFPRGGGVPWAKPTSASREQPRCLKLSTEILCAIEPWPASYVTRLE